MKNFIIIILSIAIFFSCKNNSTQKKAVKADSTEFKISNNPLNDSIQNISNEIKLKPAEHIVRSSQLPNNNHPILKYEDVKNGDTIFFDKEDGYDKVYQNYNEIKNGNIRTDINEQFPYGPKELLNNDFPSDFFRYAQKDFHDTTRIIDDLYNICLFYFTDREDTLSSYWGGDNLGEGSLCLPKIKSAQYLSFGKYENTYFGYDDYFRNPLDHLWKILEMKVVYRFPDIQNNEIYLTSHEANTQSYNCWPFYTEYGQRLFGIKDVNANLLIINKTTKHATIVKTLSFECNNDFNVDFRFFIITQVKKVIIYKMESKRLKDWDNNKYTNEYDIRVRKTDIITINSNNEIVIKNLNNSY